jgi:hypothetical protein
MSGVCDSASEIRSGEHHNSAGAVCFYVKFMQEPGLLCLVVTPRGEFEQSGAIPDRFGFAAGGACCAGGIVKFHARLALIA